MLKIRRIRDVVISVGFLTASGIAHAAPTELLTNGGFETGDFTGWSQAVAGTQSVTTLNPFSGTYAVNFNNTSPAASLIQQFNIGAGVLTPGQDVTLSFKYRGTAVNGAVLFAEVLSLSGGGGVSDLDLNGPLFPNADPDVWTMFTATFAIGPDVGNGLQFQINASCGAVAGCLADYYLDDISLTADIAVVPVPAAVWLFGSGLLGLIGVARRKTA